VINYACRIEANAAGTMVRDPLLPERRDNAMPMNVTSKFLQYVVVIACLVLVLPISALLHQTEGRSMKVHPRASTTDESGHPENLPGKPCPVMDLRAGLAVVSMKSVSKTSDHAQAVAVTEPAVLALSISPHSVLPTSVHTLGPDLSILRILRI